MTTYRKTRQAFEIQHIRQNLGTLPADTRTLPEKANSDAVRTVRWKINDLLTVKDSHAFITALGKVRNKWTVINSARYHTLALLVAAIDKTSHTKASRFRLTKAIHAAREAGWAVAMDKRNVGVTGVEWIG